MAKGKPLTHEQIAQIKYYVGEGLTDKEIATQIGCNDQIVARHRKKLGLFKPGGKVVVNEEIQYKGSINKTSITLSEKEIKWAAHLRHSKRFKRLETQFIQADLDFFVEQWVAYHIQLEDMTPAEEDLLEQYIIYNIRINHNQKDFLEAQRYEESLMASMTNGKNAELDLENEEDRFKFELNIANKKLKQEINKELKDLREGAEKIMRALNVTREQRESQNKVGADTFLTLVRMFQDADKRKEIGVENERIRIATENKIKQFKQGHKFQDGNIEPIIMDGGDFIKKDEANGK